MKIRFYNAKIAGMEKSGEVLDGELWTNGELIDYIGAQKPLPSEVFDREINLAGKLILPGFKNAHTHSAMTFLRSYADDLPLLNWLDSIFPIEEKLDEETVYYFTKLAILEYLSSGITANFDMYFFPDMIAKAAIDTGFRTVICGMEREREKAEALYKRYANRTGLVSTSLGFHAEYTWTESDMLWLAELSQKYRAPIYTHNSESFSEVEQCMERTGKTPTEYMDSLGLFSSGGALAHCVHMSDNDLKILAKRNIHVITNPSSNLKLASGIPRLTDMQSLGINIAIGTDGAASNNALDFFREMYLTSTLQKYKNGDASALPANDVLHMATVGGAKVMNLPNADILANGKLADLTIIDLNMPNMQPINNILKNLVYSGSKQNVYLTMVAGKILYEDGKYFLGENEESIYKECEGLLKAIKKRAKI